jgi:hypothetical protein
MSLCFLSPHKVWRIMWVFPFQFIIHLLQFILILLILETLSLILCRCGSCGKEFFVFSYGLSFSRCISRNLYRILTGKFPTFEECEFRVGESIRLRFLLLSHLFTSFFLVPRFVHQILSDRETTNLSTGSATRETWRQNITYRDTLLVPIRASLILDRALIHQTVHSCKSLSIHLT